MSEQSKDGGPAFPNPYIEADPLEKGMSLRDWLAGQAMAAILRNYSTDSHSLCAANAYDIADEMLLARSTPPAKGE